MSRNRNFRFQFQIPLVNPALGMKFYESRFKTAIMTDKMPNFFIPLSVTHTNNITGILSFKTQSHLIKYRVIKHTPVLPV